MNKGFIAAWNFVLWAICKCLRLKCDGSRDPESPVGPLPIDWSKASLGTGARPYEATNSFGLSQPTTLTDSSVGATKARVPDWLLSRGGKGLCPGLATQSG
jgi:hypothetical protein